MPTTPGRTVRTGDVAEIAAPVALLVAAAIVRDVRFPALALLTAGLAAQLLLRRPAAAAWAAPLPVAVSLAWGFFPQPTGAPSGIDCASIASPPAVWRLAEAALALATLGLVARAIRGTRGELGLTVPGRATIVLAAAGGGLAAAFGLLVGTDVAAPFFGAFRLDLGQPAAYVPALIFAVSNGVMEELAYRGALLGWLGRISGPVPALTIQALVFGLAHAGPDITGSAIPVVLAMSAGGLIAGIIVLRTRSVLLPIAVHVALDLPLYFYWACRLG